MTKYVVTAPCLVHVPFDTPQGRQLGTLYTGAVVPESAPKEKIQFWLDGGMIRKVEAAPEPEQTEEPGSPEVSKSQGPTPAPEGDLAPPPTGGAGSGKDAWVDYAVKRGFTREEAEGMSRDDLIKVLKPAE
ncbi:hypothetical protein [Actinomadura luteofluorescens]|uniref:hypothetical protein n=1 Tax=Actinomadura luteofluorescens TaxID=46163 RepID=UPI003D92826A